MGSWKPLKEVFTRIGDSARLTERTEQLTEAHRGGVVDRLNPQRRLRMGRTCRDVDASLGRKSHSMNLAVVAPRSVRHADASPLKA